MKIKKLNLLYFRNYAGLNIGLHPNFNIFVGNNGNGKTNIIESIYLMSLGKSFRTKKDYECIKFGEEATCVSCTFEKNGIENDIMLAINNKGKNISVSGIKKNKLIDFIGELNVVLFSPDDLQLIKGSPTLRRDFIDKEFYQFSKIYHKYSLMYKHLLKQRNSFLKEMKKNKNDNLFKTYLETITLQLVKVAIYLTKERYKFIEELNKLVYKNMIKISNGDEKLNILYKSSILDLIRTRDINDINLNEDNITSLIMQKMDDDIITGSTKIGLHHDDLVFKINGLDAKSYASQGQQRSIVLALKLSIIKFLKNKTGNYPILLLDDVCSELDKNRQLMFFESIDAKIQTFITTPTISSIKESILKEAFIFNIENDNAFNIINERK